MNLIRDIYRHRDLLLILISRNIKIRYKNSALGFLWTLLSPIFLILIYAIFLGIMRFQIDPRVLVTGIIVWQYLAMCMGDSLHAIIGNANMVKKSSFPRIVLPLSMVLANLVNFLLSMIVVFVYLLFSGASGHHYLWLPLVVLCQFALCLGLSLIISSINVFFRDAEHILSVIMMAWFFLTPIIYPIAMVTSIKRFGPVLQALYILNPMTGIVCIYRAILLSTGLPNHGVVVASCGVALIVLGIGTLMFQKLQVRFADVL